MERLTKTMQDALNKIPDRGLREVVAKLGATVLERQNQPEGKRPEPTTQETDDSGQEEEVDLKSIPPEKRFPSREHYLPEWSDNKRGVPNTVLRGALFPAIQGKARKALKGELLATQKGVEIRFTGWQLDQADLDVWEYVLHMHMIQREPLGVQMSFSAHSLLRSLGLSVGKSDYDWLKDAFRRLAGAVVEITYAPGMTYAGNMLDFWRDDTEKKYTLEVNPRLAGVYAAGWTAIDYQKRKKFRRKPLALWLHGYYSSHAKPFSVKVEYLYRLSGSRNKNIRDFKYQLKKALETLVTHGAIQNFSIEGDMVTVEVIPSNSQKKFLDRQKASEETRNATDAGAQTRDTTDAHRKQNNGIRPTH